MGCKKFLNNTSIFGNKVCNPIFFQSNLLRSTHKVFHRWDCSGEFKNFFLSVYPTTFSIDGIVLGNLKISLSVYPF